ncbi:unnamed protein product [Diplocarpon coronariae]
MLHRYAALPPPGESSASSHRGNSPTETVLPSSRAASVWNAGSLASLQVDWIDDLRATCCLGQYPSKQAPPARFNAEPGLAPPRRLRLSAYTEEMTTS